MNKERKKDKSFLGRLRSSMLVSMLLIGMVVGMVMIVNMNPSEILLSHGRRGWRSFASADTGGGPLSGDVSGFLYFRTYPHQAVPATAYASNLSNASGYEVAFYLNSEMVGETPYNTAFDFVVKFRVNDTVGYNTTSGKWMNTWVRAFITVDFNFAADVGNTSMTIVEIKNTTDFAWYHGYINNAGMGYQITKNEKFNVTSLVGQGYW